MSKEVIQALSLMPPTRPDLEMSPPGAPAASERGPGTAPEQLSRFNDFYARHAQFVARSLRRLGIHDELLDDALQEVFVIVHRKLPELFGAEHEKTWVFRITMNVAANMRRQNQRWLTKLGGGSQALPQDLPSGDDQLQRMLRDERLTLLYQVLGTLDEDKRNVFVLHELEQLGIPEVAEALGLNLNTAYSRLRAARAAFERGVEQHLKEHGSLP